MKSIITNKISFFIQLLSQINIPNIIVFKLSDTKTDDYLVVHAKGKRTIENANRLIDYVNDSL